ncbi:hypothetical protein [Ferviditalea candida]|uniref:Uncharacterized protein n=1 Tax=Ferviditalea candida TaxID=3108399 RepID=A0ABU5ZG88_9BACL|nr:hypothetical protein [Paenibacillaceae bacterium T2]
MAAKKWPKWLIGLSSVVSFTGFLYLSQSHSDAGVLAKAENPADNSSADSRLTANGDTEIHGPANSAPDNQSTGKLFVHTRAEFQQIAGMLPEAKSEREQLLEKLDWDPAPNELTAAVPESTGIKIVPVPKPAHTQAAVRTAPQKTTSVTARTTAQVQTKSDRRTRRS